MKINFLVYILVLSSNLFYSQSKDSLQESKFYSLHTIANYDKFDYNYLSLDFQTKQDFYLTVYNKSTQQNDLYLMVNDSAKYYKSNIDFNNNFRGNKRDSFNPYGASNAKQGAIIGAIGELFKGIFNND